MTILSFLVTLCLSRLFSSAFVTFVTRLLRVCYVLKINVNQWWRGFDPLVTFVTSFSYPLRRSF